MLIKLAHISYNELASKKEEKLLSLGFKNYKKYDNILNAPTKKIFAIHALSLFNKDCCADVELVLQDRLDSIAMGYQCLTMTF